jgi:hypothetical protein
METRDGKRAAACCAGLASILLILVAGLSAQQSPTSPPAGLAAAPGELQQALDESTLPQSVPELLAELTRRTNDIQQTIASGAFSAVWVPAMATKTVALALESRTPDLPNAARRIATRAIKQIVTAAWDLDTYGDLGDKARIDAAYARLAAGVTSLKAVYAAR